VKFPCAVTRLSWALPLSYYRASTFLPFRMNEPKMNELSATIVKNQPFWLLWCLFPYLRLKLDHLESDSIVTRELIHTFVLCRISKPSFITICSTTFVMWPSILHPLMKKNLEWLSFFLLLFLQPSCALVISKKEVNNSYVYFRHLFDFDDTCITTSAIYNLPANLKLA